MSREDHTITLAMADPLDVETIAAVRHCTGLKVSTVLAPEQEILDAIDKYYGDRPRARRRISSSRPARCRKISNTCATWRAKRPSSGW